MAFAAGGDGCLSIFRDVWATGALVFPSGARVLEIGCAEADWMTPMLAERPDLNLTGIDWRRCPRPGTVIHGDVLTQTFPAASFDAVVGISSIEHIGLGHYSDDPLDPEGDRHCLEKVVSWLTPGGWVYADVPYDPTGFRVHGTEYRTYDDAAIADRLIVPGLRQVGAWYVTGTEPTKLLTSPPPPYRGMTYVAILATKD